MSALQSVNSPRPATARAWAFRAVLGLIATVAAAVFLAHTADWERARSGLGTLTANPGLLAGFLLLYTLCFWLRAVAWRRLFSGPASSWGLFCALQIALGLNHLLPVKAGEAARPLIAARHGPVLPEAIATTAGARLLDFACLLLIAVLLLPLTVADSVAWLPSLAAPVSTLLLLAMALAGARWVLGGRYGSLPAALRPMAARLNTAVAQITLRRLASAALWALPSWVLEGSVLYIASRAMGMDLPLPVAVAATAFAILFQAVQLTPGGLGVYESAMAGALALSGIPASEALTVATVTHGMKFAYSYLGGAVFGLLEARDAGWLKGIDALRGTSQEIKGASRLEVIMARLWNVVNEGKPFTPLFTTFVIAILCGFRVDSGAQAARALLAYAALLPLFGIFFRYDFPLKLRAALWVYLGLALLLFRWYDPLGIALVLVLYFGFTVALWGTVYYHLRMGIPYSNFFRFWRLVLENPDPTSGNFLEQTPKAVLLVLLFGYLSQGAAPGRVLGVEAFILAVGMSAVLVHQRFATWAPPPPLTPTRTVNTGRTRHSRRFIAIVIDGCRADRFREARTPFCDALAAEGLVFTNMQTVYPARTTTCFSSMLTGAPPRVHGMRSNFVPRLGVRCDSIFSSFERQGLRARLVGIAHLIDAFGDTNVTTVTATMKNDEIDLGLVARAKEVLKREDPDLLVLQLLSVDQTGHARGSYNREYLEKIEASDRIIEDFLRWCRQEGYLQGATVLITADHGQGIGIGGHGHMSRTEVQVPCILWGAGVPGGVVRDDRRSIMDIAPTVSYFLGALPPRQSVGQVLVAPDASGAPSPGPLAIVIPCLNEARNLPAVLSAIPYDTLPGSRVIVVDDGSTDGSGDVARERGAIVVRHERRRGLGAALRSGLEEARRLDARAAVYLDADDEYDPREIPALLAPILAGEADYVIGNRFAGRLAGMSWERRLSNRAFSLLLSATSGHWIKDGQGGFRAFSRRALAAAEIIHDYNYAQVLTLDLLHKGMRLAQVPITYTRRKEGRSFISAEYLWRVPVGMARELLSD